MFRPLPIFYSLFSSLTTGHEIKTPLFYLQRQRSYKLLLSEQRAHTEDAGLPTAAITEKKSILIRYTLKQVLELAAEMAGGNQQLAAMIDKEVQQKPLKTRGRVEGPIAHEDRIDPEAMDTYEVEFVGQEIARVAVAGDGTSDLDLFIFDP